jgi:hypothetical protein
VEENIGFTWFIQSPLPHHPHACVLFLHVLSSTNKTDRHDITEILLKVVFNAITLTPYAW